MATFDYSGLANTADVLITRFGRSMILRRQVSTPDGSRPWEITIADEDTTITAVLEYYNAGEINNTTILSTDKRFMIAAKDLNIGSISGTDIAADSSGNQITSTVTDLSSNMIVGMWLEIAGFATAGNNGRARVEAASTYSLTVAGPALTDEASGLSIIMNQFVIPEPDFFIIDGNLKYRIINVEEEKPGPTAVIYLCQGRV